MEFANIKKYLGKPYYEAPNCLIYCGDCVELMPQLPSDSFHLTITSPPYNIGKEYEQPMSLDDYVLWCLNWINQVYRLTKANGAFWLNLGYTPNHPQAKALPLPYLLWDKNPFFLIQEIVWHYGAGVAGRKFFSPRNEKFLWYVKDANQYTFNLDDVRDPDVKYPNQKKNGKLKVNPNGKNPSDVWAMKKVTSGQNRSSEERTPHPAQFPEEVIERIILASSHLGNFVFDPFMGSGTTALTALKLGRPVVGIEIQPQYCDIIANRIDTFLDQPLQTSLFTEG
ncbi:MAG: site-specific DNA-methyltransferase [bacterium]|nr:site-specific DNA-methyltransferase [bacterium]